MKTKSITMENIPVQLMCLLFMASISIFSARSQSTGDLQQEYLGYESMGSTDMVNLLTGDFTYSLPLLHVPSPEGGFSLPVSYYAGIRPDQESSWVGLGWSLNCGAIIRQLNCFPDDAYQAPHVQQIDNHGGHGYINNYILFTTSYDSERGRGGTISLGGPISIGWGADEGWSVSEHGFTVGSYQKGVQFDADQFAFAIASDAMTAASYGAFGPVNKATAASLQTASKVIDRAAMVYTSLKAYNALNNATSINNWRTVTKSNLIRTTYKYYLDIDVNELACGALYLQDAGLLPSSGFFVYKGASTTNPTEIPYYQYGYAVNSWAHDMNQVIESDYANSYNPANIAYDNYSVMGQGISGSITPYRHEVGSLAFTTYNDFYNRRYCLVPFEDYKVNFRYLGDNANHYTHHYGSGPVPATFYLYSQFGMEEETDNGLLRITDETLYYGPERFESDRQGLLNHHLSSGNYITWYSNEQIRDNTFIQVGADYTGLMMDFKAGSERTSFRQAIINNGVSHGIGGFSITRADGFTYHYTLPIYNKNRSSYQYSQTTLTTATSVYDTDYAVTWLLTGITGPDFIDINNNQYIDEQDWGSWVKFEYGKFSTAYRWKIHYSSMNYSPQSTSELSRIGGTKETYYLNAIKTRTHTALFLKSLILL